MYFWFLLAFLLGVVVTLMCTRRKTSGALKVFIPDEAGEPPYLYVELDGPVDTIYRKKKVSFKVSVTDMNSQK